MGRGGFAVLVDKHIPRPRSPKGPKRFKPTGGWIAPYESIESKDGADSWTIGQFTSSEYGT